MLVNKALQELKARKKASLAEVIGFIKEVRAVIKDVGVDLNALHDEVLSEIGRDIDVSLRLNRYLDDNLSEANQLSYPLRHNKNFELFSGSLEFAKNYYCYLISERILQDLLVEIMSEKRVVCQRMDSYVGYIKIYFYNCLYLLMKKDVSILHNHLQKLRIFNPLHSPNIQGTLLPNSENFKKAFADCLDWKYFASDNEGFELLYFSNGYAYGGSFFDDKYRDKEFKDEDCLTSLLKWLGCCHEFTKNELIEISTADLADCAAGDEQNLFFNRLMRYLQPVNDFSKVEKGDVFLYREYPNKESYPLLSIAGHVGIVYEVNGPDCFSHISYSRRIPSIEGLVIEDEDMLMHPYKKYMFFKAIKT
jgi:hypothetical protein